MCCVCAPEPAPFVPSSPEEERLTPASLQLLQPQNLKQMFHLKDVEAFPVKPSREEGVELLGSAEAP